MSETTVEQPQAGFPQRELRDPRALRAFAHPVRLQIMEELAKAGQATATELAERIDESAANCSWHLRQLAQYGFIEEAGGGSGRQRPWKITVQSNRWGRPEKGQIELARAGDAATEVIVDREVAAYRAWLAARHAAPDNWRDASFLDQSWDWMTAEELAAFKEDFFALVERHILRHAIERADPARRPPGSRMIRLVAWAIPGDLDVEIADPPSGQPG
jgi:DNA-binding transcriptional ArsR family regulator